MLATTEHDLETRVYDSVAEFIEYAMATDAKSKANRQRVSGDFLEHITANKKFIGRKFKDEQELVAEANGVWPEGLSLFDDLLSQIGEDSLPAPKSRRRRPAFDSADGAELDYDRLRSGQDFWRTSRRQVSSGPANVTLSVDVGANCRRKARDIAWRGVAAIVLVELLERNGYRVELWSHHYSTGTYVGGIGQLSLVRLKALSDPLDVSTLSNAVSGWFFRTIGFAETTQSHDGRLTSPGLGRAMHATTDLLTPITGDPETIKIQEVWNRDGALSLIRTVLARFA